MDRPATVQVVNGERVQTTLLACACAASSSPGLSQSLSSIRLSADPAAAEAGHLSLYPGHPRGCVMLFTEVKSIFLDICFSAIEISLRKPYPRVTCGKGLGVSCK